MKTGAFIAAACALAAIVPSMGSGFAPAEPRRCTSCGRDKHDLR